MNVETVACGKQSVGLTIRRKTFNVAETLNLFISIRILLMKEEKVEVQCSLEGGRRANLTPLDY